ncbi:MAG: YggS family pyridoxal phosphate-dependent enzyme [Actinomycetota bacterium]
MTDSETLRRNIAAVRRRIQAACDRSGRDPGDVLLVAVTKTVSVDVIVEARSQGVDDFAENYASELVAKAPLVEATWHFIGKVQRGTAHHVADHSDVIHSAEPGRALERIGRRAASVGKRIRCLLQVDYTELRQGLRPEDVPGAVEACSSLDGIVVAGLMTLPPWLGDPEATRPFFAHLRILRDRIRSAHPGVVELSMGMSGDYEVAVEEGATMVRIGTALFGPSPVQRLPGDASPGEDR